MLAAAETANLRLERAEALLAEMGLEHRLNQFPNELSAGERQRVAIARALANNPTILLADEPTGNLDSVNSARIMEILIGIQKRRGMTLIVITHEDEIAALGTAAYSHPRREDRRMKLFPATLAASSWCASSQPRRRMCTAFWRRRKKRVQIADFRAVGHLVGSTRTAAGPPFPSPSRRTGSLAFCGWWSTSDPRQSLKSRKPLPAYPARNAARRPKHDPDCPSRRQGAAAFPFPNWSDGPLGPGFSYEDFLDPEYFWPGQTALGPTRLGARSCDILKSTPGAADKTHYAEVRSWLDHRIGFPVYVEKTLKWNSERVYVLGLRKTAGSGRPARLK